MLIGKEIFPRFTRWQCRSPILLGYWSHVNGTVDGNKSIWPSSGQFVLILRCQKSWTPKKIRQDSAIYIILSSRIEITKRHLFLFLGVSYEDKLSWPENFHSFPNCGYSCSEKLEWDEYYIETKIRVLAPSRMQKRLSPWKRGIESDILTSLNMDQGQGNRNSDL